MFTFYPSVFVVYLECVVHVFSLSIFTPLQYTIQAQNTSLRHASGGSAGGGRVRTAGRRSRRAAVESASHQHSIASSPTNG